MINRMTMVLLALAKRSHKVQMHYHSCGVHPQEIPQTNLKQGYDLYDVAPVQYTKKGACTCGWHEEAEETNKILAELETAT